jgi:type VI secretion system secreted protein Hcp
MAKADYFLKLGDIKGEATCDKHKEWIEIHSFSWGEKQGGSDQHVGHGAGKVQMDELTLSMGVNKASAELMLSCASGHHIKKAELSCCKAGKVQHEYLRIELEDILVTSYHISGHEGSAVSENFSLKFNKIKFEYKEQKADGTVGSPVKAGWDQKGNQKV